MKYYIIPIEIVALWQRVERASQSLYFQQTKDGRWVINVGCNEELFNEIEWSNFTQVTLKKTDFPEPPPLN